MTRIAGSVRRHPWWVAIALLIVGGAAWFGRDLIALALPDQEVSMVVPTAARLTASSGETIFRINPEKSQATIVVKEKLAGRAKSVDLVTHGIAGDVAVNDSDVAKSRVGEIRLNVQQLKSDNSLRDKAIRHSYLDSYHFPFVTLTNVKVSGLTQRPSGTSSAKFTLSGDLKVKNVTKAVTFDATARVDGDTLNGTATAKVKLSDFGVGPITKIGLVQTENEAQVNLDLVAENASGYTPPARLTMAVTKTADGNGPSFNSAVRPILEKNCVACHSGEGMGIHSMRLEQAGDAAEVADGLATVTAARYMPPWPASKKGVPLMHDRSLSDADIATIQAWAKAGGKLDVDATTKLDNKAQEAFALPDVDVKIQPAQAFTGPSNKLDDYRCLIFDPKITKPEAMIGYRFIPDKLQVVHHVLAYRFRQTERAAIDARENADPQPGFDCVGTIGMGRRGGDLIGGWVPGQRPMITDGTLGFDLQPGDFFVAQIHYHYENVIPPADRSTIELDYSETPTKVKPIRATQLIAPVELPCPAGTKEPLCDRDAALQDAVKRFPPLGGQIPNFLHSMCGTTPAEVAAKSNGITARTDCTFTIRHGGQLVSFLGHEHEIGKSYRMTLNPGTPQEKILLDIPNWDFNWQLNYSPVEKIDLKEGDKLKVECTWDRSLRYDEHPQYIFFAEGTRDEMCFSTVSVVPETKE